MLSHFQQTRTRILQVADGCLFAIGLLAGYILREAGSRWFHWHALEPIAAYLWLLPAVVVLGPLVLAGQGFYEAPRASQRLPPAVHLTIPAAPGRWLAFPMSNLANGIRRGMRNGRRTSWTPPFSA